MPGYEQRQNVTPEMQPWEVLPENYNPTEFTDEVVLTTGIKQGWADPADAQCVDYSQRVSYVGDIQFDENGRPLNPAGRTGLKGRGLLGKWGPNQAADPIVFAPNIIGKLSILLIRRKDTGEWALPGGMVDAGEQVSATVRRELEEETGVNADQAIFTEIYRGYVEDPRNTDNAWIETIASYTLLGTNVEVIAGDDADDTQWKPVDEALKEPVYANHAKFIALALSKVRTTIN